MRHHLLRAAAAACCLLLAGRGHASDAAPAIGAEAPTALGEDGRNRAVDLATLRGKVVIVTFWASWCGYCRKELPALNDLQARAGDDFLRVVAVNVQDEPAAYRAMVRQMRGYSLLLARDRDGAVAASYGVHSYPNLWIIDPQGRIASHHVGYGEDSLETILDEIRRVMSEQIQRQSAQTAPGQADDDKTERAPQP